ncbi:hypothetical protein J2Y38_004774 [Flavobacterium sp. 2755]|nr:hypothetical protein [Flavobacterium sp. 2755]
MIELEGAETKDYAAIGTMLVTTGNAIQLSNFTYEDAIEMVSKKSEKTPSFGWIKYAKGPGLVALLLYDYLSPNVGGDKTEIRRDRSIKFNFGVLEISRRLSGTSFLFIPLNSKGIKDPSKAFEPDPIEIFTDNPSKLSDFYLAGVIQRIADGKQRGSDQNYLKEAISRKSVVDKSNKLFYSPTDKHKPGGWGTEMDLNDTTAFEVLNDSQSLGKQKYSVYNGVIYEFQPDNVGGWHGYPIPGIELVGQKGGSAILREWLKTAKITKIEYNKLSKQSKL